MKTAKEIANELNVDYTDFLGFLRAMKIPKFMGTYRFTQKQIDNIELLLSTGIEF